MVNEKYLYGRSPFSCNGGIVLNWALHKPRSSRVTFPRAQSSSSISHQRSESEASLYAKRVNSASEPVQVYLIQALFGSEIRLESEEDGGSGEHEARQDAVGPDQPGCDGAPHAARGGFLPEKSFIPD